MKNRLLLLIFSLAFLFVSNTLVAQDNPKISIQGTLKDANGASVADGDRQVTFKLYDVASNGTALWEETATVTVVGGIYSHNLGSVEPLVGGNFASNVYLGVTVDGLELSPRTAMTYAPYALSVASTQRVAQGGCSGQVGDIKYSILNPTQFAQENGECWVPMDGRAIAGTRLATDYGMANVPDMSGLFIRATEFSGGADRDPGRSAMAASTLQNDDNKSHSHSMPSGGSHSHSYSDSYLSNVEQDATDQTSNTSGTSVPRDGYSSYIPERWSTAFDRRRFRNSLSSQTISNSGSHSHTINSSGGSEARPKNMNFYVYIRVD